MNQLQQLIKESKGRFFSITFTKKDGTRRVINGKDKYLRLLAGGDSKVAGSGYVPIVNRNKESWASVHPDAVLEFKCGANHKTLKLSDVV